MTSSHISPIEDIIDDARNGRMYILVDDEDRENEGDLIIPAQMATPAAINFMARYGRGLICLALTRERAEVLELQPMSRTSGTRHDTAFMVSIEAREGVTTGISAADRARTIAVAVNAMDGSAELVSPGHVFPLVARDGGVLTRSGHTEAAVDVSRLAGLNPSGVICEIMKDDGTMARLPDLIPFAASHGLKIGTVRDLIAYRARRDQIIDEVVRRDIVSPNGGAWKAISHRNRVTGSETLTLVKGDLASARSPLVRIHDFDVLCDVLDDVQGTRVGLLQHSMKTIAEAGCGALVLVDRTAGQGASRSLESRLQAACADDKDAGGLDVATAAQVLFRLDVHSLVPLNKDSALAAALSSCGLTIMHHDELDRPMTKQNRQLLAVV